MSTEPDVKTDDTRTGCVIKALREAAGISPSGLAEAIGVSRELIVKIENGRRHATPENRRKIADALEVPLSALSDKEAVMAELERLYETTGAV